jgi:hypothetical protein
MGKVGLFAQVNVEAVTSGLWPASFSRPLCRLSTRLGVILAVYQKMGRMEDEDSGRPHWLPHNFRLILLTPESWHHITSDMQVEWQDVVSSPHGK